MPAALQLHQQQQQPLTALWFTSLTSRRLPDKPLAPSPQLSVISRPIKKLTNVSPAT